MNSESKLCCAQFTQKIIIYILAASTFMFIYLVVSYAKTKGIIDQYQNTAYEDMNCQVLRCKAYREMPDRLTCCDTMGYQCSLKAQCLAALYQESNSQVQLLWKESLGIVLAYVVLIWAYKKLQKIARRILAEEFGQVVVRNIQQFINRNQGRGRNMEQNGGRNQLGGGSLLTESFIADNNDICSICLDEYGEQRVVKLQCEHIFHRVCIEKWRQSSTYCPLCRNIQN